MSIPLPRPPMQLMIVGGNGRGRQFFKQHGWDDVGSDKIEQKVNCSRTERDGGSLRATQAFLSCYGTARCDRRQARFLA